MVHFCHIYFEVFFMTGFREFNLWNNVLKNHARKIGLTLLEISSLRFSRRNFWIQCQFLHQNVKYFAFGETSGKSDIWSISKAATFVDEFSKSKILKGNSTLTGNENAKRIEELRNGVIYFNVFQYLLERVIANSQACEK